MAVGKTRQILQWAPSTKKKKKALKCDGCEWQVNILPSSVIYINLNEYNQVHVRGLFYSASLKGTEGLNGLKPQSHPAVLKERITEPPCGLCSPYRRGLQLHERHCPNMYKTTSDGIVATPWRVRDWRKERRVMFVTSPVVYDTSGSYLRLIQGHFPAMEMHESESCQLEIHKPAIPKPEIFERSYYAAYRVFARALTSNRGQRQWWWWW